MFSKLKKKLFGGSDGEDKDSSDLKTSANDERARTTDEVVTPFKARDITDISDNITQQQLVERVMPMLNEDSDRFCKTRQIQARPAEEGEEIVTVTADGVETKNTAKPGDMVVRNLTGAQELYIIGAKSFPRLYEQVEELEDGWALYDPKGEVLAVEVTDQLTGDLGVSEEFLIEAPWGSDERVRVGDFLVAPFPTLRKIYRIARTEFDQTYRRAS